jgi:hypothetical protein
MAANAIPNNPIHRDAGIALLRVLVIHPPSDAALCGRLNGPF